MNFNPNKKGAYTSIETFLNAHTCFNTLDFIFCYEILNKPENVINDLSDSIKQILTQIKNPPQVNNIDLTSNESKVIYYMLITNKERIMDIFSIRNFTTG